MQKTKESKPKKFRLKDLILVNGKISTPLRTNEPAKSNCQDKKKIYF